MLCFAIFRVNLTSKSRFPACACMTHFDFKAIVGGCGESIRILPTENERIQNEMHITKIRIVGFYLSERKMVFVAGFLLPTQIQQQQLLSQH